jgi:hypothetical protein
VFVIKVVAHLLLGVRQSLPLNTDSLGGFPNKGVGEVARGPSRLGEESVGIGHGLRLALVLQELDLHVVLSAQHDASVVGLADRLGAVQLDIRPHRIVIQNLVLPGLLLQSLELGEGKTSVHTGRNRDGQRGTGGLLWRAIWTHRNL